MSTKTTTDQQVETAARAYIETVGKGDLEPLRDLLDEGLVAVFAGASSTKGEWITALEQLLPALVRNDILEVFVRGDRACVVYDFVTDTPAGAVRCVELLTVVDERILAIELLLDRVVFAPVRTALIERAAQG
ncbi:MAG: nuclear transport factor 2 family protein [Candidatus Limnocylindrales bacterium]